MKRTALLKLALLAALPLCLCLIAGTVQSMHFYGDATTANAGWWLGTDQASIGYETRGQPGWFECNMDECWPLVPDNANNPLGIDPGPGYANEGNTK